MAENTLDNKLDANTSENPLSIEHGRYYWNPSGTEYGRVKKDFNGHLPKITNGLFLDIGCSFGLTTLEIADIYSASRVIGIDRFYNRIKIARSNAQNNEQCKFLTVDANFACFEDISFDGVFCMNNFWYLISKKRSRIQKGTIERIYSFIKRGGYLFFSGSNNGIIFRKDTALNLWGTTLSEDQLQNHQVYKFLTETLGKQQYS